MATLKKGLAPQTPGTRVHCLRQLLRQPLWVVTSATLPDPVSNPQRGFIIGPVRL